MNRPSSITAFALLSVSLCVPVSGCGADARSPEAEASGETPESSSLAATVESSDTVYVQFETEGDIEAFFEEVDYSPQHWADGVREIPRMYVTEVTNRWRERSANELTVQAKKRIFFRALAPLALRSNELIRVERERLLDLADAGELGDEERDWLAGLADDYGLGAPSDEGQALDHDAWSALVEMLAVRVDEVPVSLVLAQAANESGWGTSRFAAEGNSLFGQWSFGGSGMLPEDQRASLGDYRVAAFESPLLSVIAYMRNLNTHDAYSRLRELRAQARAAGDNPRGYDLAAGLDRYSERGEEYVDELRSIIEFNSLQETDETYLASAPVYMVVPADEGR